MSQKHTEEPWEIYQTDPEHHPINKFRIFRVKGNDAESICSVEKEVDAVHIAACVNALEGINPKAVPKVIISLRLSTAMLEEAFKQDPNNLGARVVAAGNRTALAEAKKVEGTE